METEFKQRQRKNYASMQTIYNVTMGIIITGIGILMFFNELFGLNLAEKFGDPLMIDLFGGLCVVYGIFRLYRGLKKED